MEGKVTKYYATSKKTIGICVGPISFSFNESNRFRVLPKIEFNKDIIDCGWVIDVYWFNQRLTVAK